MSQPKGLYRRNNSPNWFMRFEYAGVEYRRSTKTPNVVEAKRVRDDFIRLVRVSFGAPNRINGSWEDRCQRALADRRSWLHRMRRAAIGRNRRRFGIRTPIPIDVIYQAARRTSGVCEVCSIPFVFDGEAPEKGPFAISIDRPNPGEPYSALNCRFVLRSINYAMHSWGEDAFWRIASAAVGQRLMLE